MPLELNQTITLCVVFGRVFRTLGRSFLIIKLLRPRVMIYILYYILTIDEFQLKIQDLYTNFQKKVFKLKFRKVKS